MFTEEIAAKVLAQLEKGSTLRQIAKIPGMPARSTVCDWARGDSGAPEDFGGRYARARGIGLDAIAEQILEIADTPCVGLKNETDGDGVLVKVTTGDMIEHRRLQVDARKWLLSKMRPDKYGDTSATRLINKDGDDVFSPNALEDWIKKGSNTDQV